VCNVDATAEGSISEWVAARFGIPVGAMGTRAKYRASMEKIPLDFTYGIIDKCILKALRGENTLIITTERMVRRVYDRVSSYSDESGIRIEVESFGPGSEQPEDPGTVV